MRANSCSATSLAYPRSTPSNRLTPSGSPPSAPLAADAERNAARDPTKTKSHASAKHAKTAKRTRATDPAAPDLLASLAHAEASAEPLSAAVPSSLHATVVTKIMCASLSTDRVANVAASRMTTRPSLSPATRHPPSGESAAAVTGSLPTRLREITVQLRVFHRVA